MAHDVRKPDLLEWDPLEPQPHNPDIKALLRLAVLNNIPTASNRATTDFLITSPFMSTPYERLIPDYLLRLKQIQQEERHNTQEDLKA